MADISQRDPNRVTSLLAVSSIDGTTPVLLYADPSTHALLVTGLTAGTVTSVSVVSANGFAGTVATATTTPAITLTTTVTGVLKGNSTAISAATAGSDYVAPGPITTSGLTMATNKILGRATSGTGAIEEIAVTGSGSVVLATSPTLVTPVLGVATAASINSLTITSSTGTLTISNSKVLSVSNTLTFTGTDSSSVNFGTGGTVLYGNQSITLSGDVTGTGTTAITTTVAKIAGTTVSGTTGTNNVVFSASPTLVTPVLGVASATSLATSAASPLLLTNGQLITVALTSQTVGGATLTIPDFASVSDEFVFKTKAVTMSNKTFVAPVLGAATATSLAIGGATIGSNGLAVTGHVLIEGVTSTGATGTGRFVFDNTPTLITPVLGAATATSINGLTLTSSTGTFTLTNLKTLAVTNTLTLSGTDSTVMTFPSTSASIARTDAAQTFTGIQTIPQVVNTPLAATVSSNAATITRASRINNFTNSSASAMTITLSTTGALDGDMIMVRIYDASAATKGITWVNTENSTTSAPTTSNGSTTLPLTVGFQYNSGSSLWRCIASA